MPDYRTQDAIDRVVGSLKFTLDHEVLGMAHGKTVRSSSPHAWIKNIDTESAADAPGVIAVITGADLQRQPSLNPFYGELRQDQPALAIDKVRFVGEPVAMVVADSADAAAEAAALVQIEYDPIDYVTDEMEAMLPTAPLVHEAYPGNECGSWRLRYGDLDAGWSQADLVVEGTYSTPPASQVPMEPHVAIASWEASDKLHVWSSVQAPHIVSKILAEMFSIEPSDVRVATFNVGGGYGAKSQVRIEPMVACVARLVGRPVRVELARDEVFVTIGRHAATVRCRTGVKRDGTFVAREMEVVYNAGAYAVTSPGATGQGLLRAPGPYHIPNVSVMATARYTNTVPTGPFRGAMTPQVCFAYESQIDEIAAALMIDPIELRRRNLLRDGDEFATGEVMSEMHYDELVDDAAAAIGWAEEPSRPEPGKARGKGIGITMKTTKTPSRSEVGLELTRDGRLVVLASGVELGQGASATIIEIASQEVGIPPECIDLPFPDTQHTPYDSATSSSRTTYAMSEALADGASKLRSELSQLAAAQLGCDPSQLEHRGGAVHGPDGRSKSYHEVVAESGLESVDAHGVFASRGGLKGVDPLDVRGNNLSEQWHQGAAAVEIEVDLETGRITILRAHGGSWAGRAISHHRASQQIAGCVIFGIGSALFEETVIEDGQIRNGNLADYGIPSFRDVPIGLSTSALEGEAGARVHGVGEMSLPAVAPAVANALYRATGARIRELPLTPERVLRALREPVTAPVDRGSREKEKSRAT